MSLKQLSMRLRTAQVQEGMRYRKRAIAPTDFGIWGYSFLVVIQRVGQHPLGIKERSSHDLLTKEEREALEQSGPEAAQEVARKLLIN